MSANTRYNNLRNLLPKKFEWLMTEERLALESEMQGNCVVSYANKVKKINVKYILMWIRRG